VKDHFLSRLKIIFFTSIQAIALVFLSIIFWALPSQAENCTEYTKNNYEMNNRLFLTSEEFFKQTSPILINPEDPSSVLNFSFDGELPWNELFVFFKKTSQFEEWKKTEDCKRFTDNFFLNKTASAWAHLFKLSQKQFETFVKKPSKLTTSITTPETISLFDLPPTYIAHYLDNHKIFLHYNKILKKLIETSLAKINLPVHTIDDVGFIEIQHSSYESSPSIIKNTFDRLDELFPSATFHKHIGITKNISDDALLSILRALETKMILSIASLSENTGNLAYSYFSSFLQKSPRTGIRSVLKLGDFPNNQYDLEIRQSISETEDRHLVSFASQMAQNYKKIIQLIFEKSKKAIKNELRD
jgi:hypothetical protein